MQEFLATIIMVSSCFFLQTISRYLRPVTTEEDEWARGLEECRDDVGPRIFQPSFVHRRRFDRVWSVGSRYWINRLGFGEKYERVTKTKVWEEAMDEWEWARRLGNAGVAEEAGGLLWMSRQQHLHRQWQWWPLLWRKAVHKSPTICYPRYRLVDFSPLRRLPR